ncbi:MFS general substrate transporter [Tilletiopsis washingtonensis]|uniref:MFS general substrate transporter n=1 Tax=Tilletiopsis washingtonensis TaxID=58919 RepID=A0A316Z9L6_9BASI|nr:MFS general substrate transporter [Tilletiopsis washingtonensis]PWN98487.1 MFS general substrate transporter [Tilletiopsis washingtonensis]
MPSSRRASLSEHSSSAADEVAAAQLPVSARTEDDVERDAHLENEKTRQEKDVIWVEWEENDPENPFNFSNRRKWWTTFLATFFTAEVAATASAYVPGIPSMEAELGNSHIISLLGISIYAFGFSLPPMVLAPLSEVFGRNTIYIVSHLLYTVLFVALGRAPNIATVIVIRFLSGAFGSTGSTMVGGSLADIWQSHERGLPMALFATAAIFGTGVGPVWAGWVEQNPNLGWRWIQYLQAIYTGAFFFVLLFGLKETRGSVLLTRRAKRLRKETGDQRYRARAEAERASVAVLVTHSLTRPIKMLFTEPIVTAFSLWVAFLWGFMYMLLESIGLVTQLHNFTPGQTGLVFLSICGAAILGNALNPLQEYMYKKHVGKRGPEARLYSACAAAPLFPIGAFIYGWTAYSHVSIAGPVVGITLLMTSVYQVYLSCFLYLSDSYGPYASSALAAQSFARNLAGTAFPLFCEQMYHRLGYQWASTLAGLLGAVLGIAPFVLFFKGPQIRARSKLSVELARLGLL